jgi:hypothetical protein
LVLKLPLTHLPRPLDILPAGVVLLITLTLQFLLLLSVVLLVLPYAACAVRILLNRCLLRRVPRSLVDLGPLTVTPHLLILLLLLLDLPLLSLTLLLLSSALLLLLLIADLTLLVFGLALLNLALLGLSLLLLSSA